MDLTTMTDTDLDTLRVRVLTEQEHRARLAAIPEQIAEMADQWRDAGRDPAELTTVITDQLEGE